MNGVQLKKKNPIKFPNFKDDFKNLKYFLIGSTISSQSISNDNKKMQSDTQLMIKDSMNGQMKSFFLIDKAFTLENVKKINDEYKLSQTLSNINYDAELESSILLNINSLSLKGNHIIDENWLTVNNYDQNLESYAWFNDEWEGEGNMKNCNSLMTKIKTFSGNLRSIKGRKEIKVGDVKQKAVVFIKKYSILDAFLSIGNVDTFLYIIELLSEFKYINEKKLNFVVAEVLSLISAFMTSEIKSQYKSKEITEFFKKNGLKFFSLLINRVF